MARTDSVFYGPYAIRVMRIAGAHQAQIFRGRVTIGPRHHGATPDEALEAAKIWLDRRAEVEARVRATTHIPSVEAYREALSVIEINAAETAMLDAHIAAPRHTLTATQLAEAAGWDSWSSANLHYGLLGRKIAEAMRWTPPLRPDGTEIWTMAIATGPHDIEGGAEIDMAGLLATYENGGQFEWVVRPQLVEALTGSA